MKTAAALATLAFLAGCATRPPLPPETGAGQFVIEEDLLGQTTAKGEFRAINGTVRPFTAVLNGTFDGRTFTLVEDFVFADGEKDRKTWVLERVGPGEYRGRREDTVGDARGFQDGRAFRLEYTMQLPAGKDGKPGRKLKFRDIMVETKDGMILNRATIGLFGLRVGSVNLVISR